MGLVLIWTRGRLWTHGHHVGTWPGFILLLDIHLGQLFSYPVLLCILLIVYKRFGSARRESKGNKQKDQHPYTFLNLLTYATSVIREAYQDMAEAGAPARAYIR